ncbi:hypothetical protein CCACVL1_27248 [Corchorus capsularis]|uniref:Retrotransposon gag protein n=1 Tax=Corchorus capsularis TaxID=210143 RepID=A0A1R3GBG1_COCAP|nr:hypothetical protein CCACVL1_27248 [Corchorus capsularis]
MDPMMELITAMTSATPGSSGAAQTIEAENVPSTGVTVGTTQVNVPILSSSQIDVPIPPPGSLPLPTMGRNNLPPGQYTHPNMSSTVFEPSPPTILPFFKGGESTQEEVPYRYIDELAPTRETLHSMKRKPGETIKEYGQRFKDMALEVDPLMKDIEVGDILLKTLPKEYFRELYQAATDSFTRLIIAGEAYEAGLRAGVFEEAEKKGHAKKKEGDTHECNSSKYPKTGLQGKDYPIDPIPYTYTELLPQLLQQNLVQRLPYMNPMKPPLPAWNNFKAHCDFHSGAEGHATEDCLKLKYVVQDLVKNGKLRFGNTVPTTQGQGQENTQVIMVERGEVLRRKVSEIATPFEVVFKALTKAEMIETGEFRNGDHEEMCPYHGLVHGIRQCPELRGKLQRLMDEHRIEFYLEKKEEEIDVVLEECNHPRQPFIPRPIQPFIPRPPTMLPPHLQAPCLVVIPPRPFSYEKDCQVPWKYDCSYTVPQGDEDSANITGVGGMTRSGRIYSLEDKGKSVPLETGGEKSQSPGEGKEGAAERGQSSEERKNERTAKPIPGFEAEEFMKIIKYTLPENQATVTEKFFYRSLKSVTESHL